MLGDQGPIIKILRESQYESVTDMQIRRNYNMKNKRKIKL